MFLLVLAAQAAGSIPAQAPAEAIIPTDFDLKHVAPAPAGDEIVVTARRRDDQRLKPLTAYMADERLPRAETGLGGNVRAGITAESEQLPGGVVSNRVMVKLKMPL